MFPLPPKFRFLAVSFGLGLLVTGCATNSNGTFVADPPHCSITSQSEFIPEGPGTLSKIRFTIASDGEGPAYNVLLTVKLKQGGTIVSEHFTGTPSLKRGESIAEELWFPEVKTRSDFGSVEASLTWSDYDGGVYP